MQTKQKDRGIINKLIRWRENGCSSFLITHPNKEPMLHDSFLRLEELDIAIFLEVQNGYFVWEIDNRKLKEASEELDIIE